MWREGGREGQTKEQRAERKMQNSTTTTLHYTTLYKEVRVDPLGLGG